MRVLPCVFLIAFSEAARIDRNKPRDDFDDELPSPQKRKIDVYPEPFPEPVPFGHISLAGVGDPFSSVKQPVDGLELNMVKPRNSEEVEEMLKKGRRNIQFMRNTIPKNFALPRDMYLSQIEYGPEETNDTRLKWYDLAEKQIRDVIGPPARYKPKRPVPALIRNNDPKGKYFGKDTFELKHGQGAPKLNWTTCDEFAVGAIFSPNEIVEFEWTPFFIWSIASHPYSIVHTFRNPTKKVVDDYHRKYRRFLTKMIDWSQPKLLMKGMTEMLLIAADKRGLFDAIPKHDIPKSMEQKNGTLPSLSIRLKIEDPYLVMMFCEDYFATIMAISGNEPTAYRDMKAEAASIKFIGSGRPVWRDKEREKEKIEIERDIKLQEEADKFLYTGGKAPIEGIDTV